MISPAELAARPFYTAAEHKSRSTVLKRLSTGIRVQAIDGLLGLDPKQLTLLRGAMTLLDAMATTSAKAATIAHRAEQAAQKRRDAISSLLRQRTAARSAADKVAVIADTAHAFFLHDCKSRHDLDRLLREAIVAVAYHLARDIGTSVDDLVDAELARLELKKPALIARFQPVINCLEPQGTQPCTF